MNRYLPPPDAVNPIPGDPTESARRSMIATGRPESDLEEWEGPVWDTAEAVGLFEFIAFAAPFVLVRRRADGVEGTLKFVHAPRRYFDFVNREE